MIKISPVSFNSRNYSFKSKKIYRKSNDEFISSPKKTKNVPFDVAAKSAFLNRTGKKLINKADCVVKCADFILKIANDEYNSAFESIKEAKFNNFSNLTGLKPSKTFIKNENDLYTMVEGGSKRVERTVVFNPKTLEISSISRGLNYLGSCPSREKIYNFNDKKLSSYIENTVQQGDTMTIDAQYNFDNDKLVEYSEGITKKRNSVTTKLGFYFVNGELSDCKVKSEMDNTGLYIKGFYTFINGKLAEYFKDSMPFSMDVGEHYSLDENGYLVKHDE